MARTRPIIADVPVAKPSIPSVKLAPFETAVTIKITIGIKTNQAQSSAFSTAHDKRSA